MVLGLPGAPMSTVTVLWVWRALGGGVRLGSGALGRPPTQRTYVLGVPGLVGRWRAGQEGNVGHEDGQQQQGAHDLPGRPPVEARPRPSHPGYVITEPAAEAPSSGRQSPSRRQAVAHGTVPPPL